MSYGLTQSSTGMNPTTANTGMMKEKIPSGYKKGAMNNFTPEQMNLFQQMFGQVGPESYLSKLAGGDQETFDQMEAPALRQFSGIQGNLASRFSGMGGLGARRSSGFQNTMNSAASNFAQELQANRQNLMGNARKELFDMSNSLLSQRPQENFMIKKQNQEPFWKQMLGIVSPVGGDIASGGTQNTQNFFNALKLMGGA
jgi:hypothetical protein|tara:strand:- start:1038 stop:1634 length:597 start_codon:yes stop_codon:yes gene_type:complete